MKIEAKQALIQKLQTIVDKNVKFWKEDFETDARRILEKQNNLPMVFLARECGTLLISWKEAETYKTAELIKQYADTAIYYLRYYLEEQPDRVKLYTIHGDKVKQIKLADAAEAFALIDATANDLCLQLEL